MFSLFRLATRVVLPLAAAVGATAAVVVGKDEYEVWLEKIEFAWKYLVNQAEQISVDPKPFMSALGVFLVMVVWNKMRGLGLVGSTVAALFKARVIVPPSEEKKTEQAPVLAAAMARLAAGEIRKRIGELIRRREALPKEIKDMEKEHSHAENDLAKAKVAYDKALKEFKEREEELADSRREADEIDRNIAASEAELAKLENLTV